ncbi:TRAP transporter small permease [candidate division KSB1 bacterium]
MKILHWIDRELSSFESFMLVLLLFLLVGLAFLQVVLRNFFNTGFIWLDPLLRHMVIWLLFLGAAQATRHKKHLNIDALTKILKKPHKRIAALVINAFSLCIVIFLAYGAWNYLLIEFETGTARIIGIERGFFITIIPLGMVLIGYRFLLHFIDTLLEIIKGAES